MFASSDPTFPLFPIFSFLGFILSVIPFSWHLQAWNSGTCAFMIWTALSCLNSFINSLVWKGSMLNPAPVWCDISTKIMIGSSIGLPASILCISRRLYSLTSTTTVSVTRADKRRMVLIDLAIAAGIPAIIMVLHYVVQAHRFDILQDIGCYPVVYHTLLSYFIYSGWPVALGCVSLVFSCLTLRSFWLRRAQFNQLVTSNNAMSMSRYLRLMVLAMVDIMFTVPLSAYMIHISTKGLKLNPWISWEEVHYDWYRVATIPTVFWRSDPAFEISVELTRWLPVICAFIFFGLFGFASEAQKQYKRIFWAAVKPFGLKPAPAKKVQLTLPSWVKPLKTGTKISSLASPTSSGYNKTISTDMVSSTATDVELGNTFKSDKGIELSRSLSFASTATCAAPPPAYSNSRPIPKHLPLDVDIDTEDAFPSSPFSESKTIVDPITPIKFKFDETFTFPPSPTTSTTSTAPRAIPPTASPVPVRSWPRTRSHSADATLETTSASPRDRYYVVNDRQHPPSPPPFSNTRHPAFPFHRPFSPPLAYPAAAPHPNATLRHVDGIRVTVQTHQQSCESLSSAYNQSR